MNDQAVFTVAQLAKRWSCARRSVLQLIHNGQLQAFKVGERAFRITIAEIERVEKQRAA